MTTERVILVCSCGGQQKKAIEAYYLLVDSVGQQVLPEIIKGRDRAMKFAQAHHNHPHLTALVKLSGRYMYYIEMEGDDIIKEIDLTTGKRLK